MREDFPFQAAQSAIVDMLHDYLAEKEHSERLEAENTRLKAEVERLRASSFVTAVPVEQYERLRKAGDAMALCITEFRCGKYGNALDKVGGFYVWQDWNAAKEGKQP